MAFEHLLQAFYYLNAVAKHPFLGNKQQIREKIPQVI